MGRQHLFSLILRGTLTGFLILPSLGFSDNVFCPLTLVVNQEPSEVDKPWETFLDDVPIRLMSVAVFEGHPNQYATLIPDEEIKKDRRQVSTWRLISSTKEIYWLGCIYDRTNVMLIRPLDRNTKVCQVTYDPYLTIAGHPSVVGINCK